MRGCVKKARKPVAAACLQNAKGFGFPKPFDTQKLRIPELSLYNFNFRIQILLELIH